MLYTLLIQLLQCRDDETVQSDIRRLISDPAQHLKYERGCYQVEIGEGADGVCERRERKKVIMYASRGSAVSQAQFFSLRNKNKGTK